MILPLSFMGTVRALFAIALVGSGIGIYLMARDIWGRFAGILAAVLYVYAPYHSLDIYIRGALSESFALAILPFLWHAIYLVIKKENYKRLLYLTVSVALLLTTHNISMMLYVIPTALWVLYWLINFKKWGSVKSLILSGFLGFGVAGFFILPLIFERSLIQTQFLTIDYLSYVAHFVTKYQLFIDRSWGHGPSIWGPLDEISFQIGWPHWWLIAPALMLSINYLRKKRNIDTALLILGLLGISGLFAFLTHSRSTFIWLKIPMLSFVQFPWRFLGPLIFTLSLLGAVVARPKFLFRKFSLSALVILIVVLNYRYFEPWNRSYEVRDEEKLSGVAWDLQRKSAILDYLPITAPDAPKEAAPESPWITKGDGLASNYSSRSNSFFFDVEVFSDEAEIQIPVQDFPIWRVVEGGKIIPSYQSGQYGAITIKLPKGKHIIQGRFENTPIRSIGNALTIISASLIFVGVVLKLNEKKVLWL